MVQPTAEQGTAEHYAYVWEFLVMPEREREFLAAYGPSGSWSRLFRRAPGYVETMLLQDQTTPGRFLTVDRWSSSSAYDGFRERFEAEYQALDRDCEALTHHEACLGSYWELVRPAGEAERMPVHDHIVGTWQLVPELSIYEAGAPPASGVYDITRSGDRYDFVIRWRSEPGGPELSAAFGGPGDGSVQTLALPQGAPVGTPDAMTITRVDDSTLDSEAISAGRVVAYARRRVSDDGSVLSVMQEVRTPDGRGPRSFQVYRRA
jgi:heme-degrading monooxygenase HmoA